MLGNLDAIADHGEGGMEIAAPTVLHTQEAKVKAGVLKLVGSTLEACGLVRRT